MIYYMVAYNDIGDIFEVPIIVDNKLEFETAIRLYFTKERVDFSSRYSDVVKYIIEQIDKIITYVFVAKNHMKYRFYKYDTIDIDHITKKSKRIVSARLILS